MSTIPASALPPQGPPQPPTGSFQGEVRRTFAPPLVAQPPVVGPRLEEQFNERVEGERNPAGHRLLNALSAMSWLVSAMVHCMALIIASLLISARIQQPKLSVQLNAPETWRRAEVETLDVQRVEIK